jgi:cytochrome c2
LYEEVTIGVACSPKKPKSAAEPTGLTKSMAQKNYSADQIAQGEALFTSSCARCHKLFEPAKFGAVKWNRVLDRMIPKAKVSTEEGELIRAYVIANADAAK